MSSIEPWCTSGAIVITVKSRIPRLAGTSHKPKKSMESSDVIGL
jgi:hypothetical protein